uniref:Uncharacterized protein n=1 Tax=Arundo donax TaxID=35708 RepID=A0A0A8Y743_ARUDO
MVNASKVEGAFVALDEPQDLVVEVEAGVPDQGPVAEDPQHHPAACLFEFPAGRERRKRRSGALQERRVGRHGRMKQEEDGWDPLAARLVLRLSRAEP